MLDTSKQIKFRDSISGRVFIYFILVIIILMLILSVSFYYISVNIVKEKVSSSFVDNLAYISNNIYKNFRHIDKIKSLINTNQDIKQFLTTDYPDLYKKLADYRVIESYFDNYLMYSDIGKYMHMNVLYGINNNEVFINVHKYVDLEEMKRYFEENYEELLEDKGKVRITEIENIRPMFPDYKYSISTVDSIHDNNHDKRIGIVYLSFKTDLLKDLFSENASLNNKGYYYIVDNHGQIAYHADQDLINKKVNNFDRIKAAGTDKGYIITKQNKSKSLVAFYHIKEYGWWVIRTISYNNLIADNQSFLIKIILILFLITFLISSIVWYFISLKVVKPIKGLIKTMNNIRKGDLTARSNYTSDDEIGLLSANFNYMVDQLTNLYHAILWEHNKIKDAEYKALQAQINPHFLYNTLNSVRWLAMIQNADNIQKAVEKLIRLLRNSTNKDSQFITIKEELELVKDYICLQKIRYKGKFDVDYNIDKEVLNYKCIKFILQPLVENAIFHGLEPIKDFGNIAITITQERQDIVFSVKDNGLGMTDEQLSNLLKNQGYDENSYSGVGINNVDQRIKYAYGSSYGIEIKSSSGEYTEVILKIPKINGDRT